MEISSALTYSISDAKHFFGQLIKTSRTEDILVTCHGHPVSIIISAIRYDEMLNRLAELEAKFNGEKE